MKDRLHKLFGAALIAGILFAALVGVTGCGNTRHIEIRQTSSNTFVVADYHTGIFSHGKTPPYSALEETCPSIGKNISKISAIHNGIVIVTCALVNRPFAPEAP